MKIKKKTDAVELRRQAEAKLSKRKKSPITETDSLRLIHELEVHQIELEMQNEELIQARADADAEEAYRQYINLYDFAPVGYFMLGRDGTIRKTNMAGANLLDTGREKIINRRFGLFVTASLLPTFNTFLEKVLENRVKETCEIELLSARHETRWAHLDAIYLEKEQEIFVTMLDITERKLAEEKLRDSRLAALNLMEDSVAARREAESLNTNLRREVEQRKRAEEALLDAQRKLQRERDILQAVMDGAKRSHLVFLDCDFNFVRVNKTYADSGGYRPEEMIGKNHFALYPHEENEAIFARVRDTGEPFEIHDKPFEFPNQPERGVTYWDWTLMPVKGAAGQVEGLIFSLFETTERIHIERALREAHEVLELRVQERTMELEEANKVLRGEIIERERVEQAMHLQSAALESAANSIMITDIEGRIQWINPACAQLTGYAFDEIVGQSPRVFWSGKQKSSFYKKMWSTIQAGRVWRGEIVNRRKNGSLYIEEETITPVRDTSGQITNFVSIKQNITERKQAEEKIRTLNQELEQRVLERTAKLEAANRELESFSYTVSHDLRTPLRAISMFADIVSEQHKANLNPEGQHFVDNIVTASSRMERLINDLLRYSRLGRQGLNFEQIPLGGILSDIVHDLQPSLAEAQGMILLDDGLPAVTADKTLLTQIFSNLLENAIKYRKPNVPPRVQVAWQADGEDVVIKVSDNGIGISDKFFEKIFDIFRRLHAEDEYDGTGIGLATVKKSVQLLGGSVWVESQIGEGSTFYVKLPKGTL